MGNGNFRPPHRIHTPWPITNKFDTGDDTAAPTTVPNLVQIRQWGLLGKWVKYNEFIFYFKPVDVFSRLMAQTTQNRTKMGFWGFRWYFFPILWVKFSQKNNFESLTRLFQAKLAKYWEFHIVETAAPISTEMAYIVSDGALKSSQTKPLVPYSGSTVKISNTWKTKMAVAAMLKITKKSRFIRCGLKHFKHSKMADGRHFENR